MLVVDKPRGPTSHDVVARMRRMLHTHEVGHAGTLDPMATGVLVVLVGEATKLAPYLTAEDKAYRATVRLGVATTSLDAEGDVIETRPVMQPSRDVVERAMDVERKRTEQVPPSVSAIKVRGVAAHRKTRRGEVVELAARTVGVRSLDALAIRENPPEIDLEVVAAKGYYVRALARDLAASLGTVGHLVALRRLRSGAFDLEETTPLDALDETRARAALLPLATAASRALPTVRLTSTGATKARQGKTLSNDDALDPIPEAASAWLDEAGALVAIGRMHDGIARVLRGMRT